MNLRILHLIPNLSGGGAERQLSYLAPALANMGHAVYIAYSTVGPDCPFLPGVILHRLKPQSNYSPFIIRQINQLIKNIKPDIIHTWVLQMDIFGGAVAKINAIPWVLREPGSADAKTKSWRNLLRVKIAAGASAIVSNSKGGDAYWKTNLPNSRRFIIANGLPFDEIDRIEPLLTINPMNTEVPMVLYAGRLISYKKIRSLFEALALIQRNKEYVCVICGAGEEYLELEMLTHKLGIDSNIYFTGHISAHAVWALMKKASVFVSLSAYEGCPNTVMEAMYCGCPLVLSDIAAHREILDDNSAFFVDPANIQHIAHKIIYALCDRDSSLKRASIAKGIAKRWSISEMAINYENLYREIL